MSFTARHIRKKTRKRVIQMLEHILCAIIVLQMILHKLERKDLYNRIMSKSYSEYGGKSPHAGKSAHKRILEEWRGKGGKNT